MKKYISFGQVYRYYAVLFVFIIFLFPLQSCRKFNLLHRLENNTSELRPTFRFDISLDDAYLSAYNKRFNDIFSSTHSSTTSNPKGRNDRVMTGKQVLVLYKVGNGTSKMARINIKDTFRSQLLIRSEDFQLLAENRGAVLNIEKILVLDNEDSTIMAAPLRNNGSETKFLDSLVDSAFRLPILTVVPLIDTGTNIIQIRMTFAGKGLNGKLTPDSLGYTQQDFKNPTILSQPRSGS